MRVYLVQHGQAEDKSVDPDRPLTDQGRRDIARLGKKIVRLAPDVYRILHSGKTRAEQTAQILGLAVKPTDGIHASDGLRPTDPVAPLVERLEGWTGDRMLVGHLPSLGDLVDALLGVSERDPDLVRFVPGTLCVLERDEDGDWTVVAHCPPEFVRDPSSSP